MLFSALFWWHWQVSCAFRRSSASCAFKAASALCSARLSRSKASLSWAVKRSCGHLESQNFPNCISNGKPAHHYHPNLMSSHQIGMWKLDCTHEISSILQPHSWFSQGSKAFQDSSQNILHRVCVCVCVFFIFGLNNSLISLFLYGRPWHNYMKGEYWGIWGTLYDYNSSLYLSHTCPLLLL